MLKGDALLKKVNQAGDLSRSDLVRECGYASVDKSGRETLNFTAFYEALIEARGTDPETETEDHDESEASAKYQFPSFSITSSGNSQLIVGPDSDDEIGKSAQRLLRVAKAVQRGCEGKSTLVAIQIEYSGRGDDGTIDNVEYLFARSGIHDEHELNEDTSITTSIPKEILLEGKSYNSVEYEAIIREAAFDISYNLHGSWFNGYGGSGFLTAYIDRTVICGEHFQDADPSDPNFDTNEIHPYYLWVQDV